MRILGGRHNSRRTALPVAVLYCLILSLFFACSNARAAVASPIPTPAKSASEVVVMLDLDGEILADSFIVGQLNDKILMPVCALAEALSLAITCGDNRAYGYILEESRPFVIDLEEGYLISGRSASRNTDSAFMQNGDIFVEISELSRWLPLDFSFKGETSTLHMHAREVLPMQAFKKRQRFKLRAEPPALPKRYDDFTPARAAISVATVDLTSQLLLWGEEHATMQARTRNSLDMSGDLLYMSGETHLFAEDENLKRLDVTLSRRSGVGFKFGPLPLTQVAIGATQAPYVDGVGASVKQMYGLYLSNRPIFGATKFHSHDIHGYLPPGWDAELFHNGTQIGYQPPTEEGKYHFVNLRVYYGINNFKVIQHGPFGERRESEEVFVSDAITPTGEVFHTISAGWQTGLTQSDTAGPEHESNVTMTSDFGISKDLTGSALLVRHVDSDGEERDYAGIGIRTAIRYTLLSVDLIQSFSPRDGSNGQLLTVRSSSRDVFGLNLEAVQRFFNDFDSPQFMKTDDPLWSRTSVKGNSSFTLWGKVRIPYSVEINADARRSGDVDGTSEWRVSGGWNGWNAALEADVSYLQKTVSASALMQISTRLREISVRGQAGVSIAPTFTPSAINLSLDRDLGREFQLNTGFLYDPVSNTSGLRLGLSKRLGLFGYSLSATGSSNGAYGVDLGIRTSIAADRSNRQLVVSAVPLSPYGMIAVSVAVPETGGSAGKPLPGVGFLVNGTRATTIRGSKGWPVIAHLQPDVPVDVTVDLTTVEDPFMVPLEDGCRVIPRAGVVSACNFTMTSGGEIDGMTFVRMTQSSEVPLRGVRVDLMTVGSEGAKLRASTRSEESGYYLFKAVKPGNYRIVIPEAEVARLKAEAVEPIPVTMPAGGDMVSGKDFYLGATAGERKQDLQ